MQRPHAVRIGTVGLRPGGQKELRNHQIGSADCQYQGGFSLIVKLIHTGRISFQQNFHHFALFFPAGVMEGGIAICISVCLICLGKSLHQFPKPCGGGVIDGLASLVVTDADIDIRILQQLQGGIGFPVPCQQH